jgi:hypothetical protein
MITSKFGQFIKQDEKFYQTLQQLQQSTLEILIQGVLLFFVIWYVVANLLGERINLPQLSISMIPAVLDDGFIRIFFPTPGDAPVLAAAADDWCPDH